MVIFEQRTDGFILLFEIFYIKMNVKQCQQLDGMINFLERHKLTQLEKALHLFKKLNM